MAGKIRNEASSSSNSNNRGETVVVDVGRRRSSCGYCRSGCRTSISHGLWAHSITVDDYQELLDRGWRRSGSFLYKPEMDKTCCPAYTIRLKASDFVAAKEQVRVSKRMQRFLDGTLDGKKPDLLMDESNTSESAAKKSSSGSCEGNNEEEQYLHHISNQIDNVVRAWAGSEDIQLPKASVKKVTHTKKKQIGGNEDLLYTSNISFQIAATLKQSQLAGKDACMFDVAKSCADQNGQSSEVSPKIIAEKIACSLNQLGEFPSLSTRACNGHLNFYSATKRDPSGEKIGTTKVSSNSPRSFGAKRCSMVKDTKSNWQQMRRLEIRLKRSSFDPEEYALYRRYQIKVHKDEPDQVAESSYRRFLVDTPIIFVPPSGDGSVPPCGFGSFHQQYLIDGQLIAVGVVDILPRCLSSKYLFWDPDFAFLSLGKYSALQEISWVRETQAVCPSLQYYYLGYYIHSCSKMRYKAAYNPSELLCPLRYQWLPFNIARPLLDRKPYVILSDSATLQNGDSSPRQLPPNSSKPEYQNPGQDRVEPPTDDDDDEDDNNDEDEEMADPDYEDSDIDDSDPETSTSVYETKDGDVSNVLLGLKTSRIRYKDLQRALSTSEKHDMENQLHRYMKVVGAGLSERMVYSLG